MGAGVGLDYRARVMVVSQSCDKPFCKPRLDCASHHATHGVVVIAYFDSSTLGYIILASHGYSGYYGLTRLSVRTDYVPDTQPISTLRHNLRLVSAIIWRFPTRGV